LSANTPPDTAIDALSDLLTAAAEQTDDELVKDWLERLLAHGETATSEGE
jgi:hypothetical protein